LRTPNFRTVKPFATDRDSPKPRIEVQENIGLVVSVYVFCSGIQRRLGNNGSSTPAAARETTDFA
jgi:hypothetical protein